ncbi:MAG: pentapeptide repeat-containing protein [Flavobacteriales bacterium]|nr:pentapeptide repeat-containing protein [Flavobacteriales bacterium]
MDGSYNEDRTFTQADVKDVPLTGKVFEACTFDRCDLSGKDLRKCKFIGCTFTGCDLSMAKLGGVSLQQVVLKECKLLGIDFSVCSEMLFSVEFEQCVLDHSVFAERKMPKTLAVRCSMKGVDFSGADLREARFGQCDLLDAVFDRTDLRQADLTSAFNFTIDPTTNRMRGARFSVEGALGLLGGFGVVVE